MTPFFDWARDFHEGLAAVGAADKVGYIRRDGSYAIPPIHHSASGIDFAEGLVAIRVKGKVGFMDRTGKWGYVDKAGNVTVPIQYQFASYYMKPDGSPAFPATFNSAMPFCGGVAFVETYHITEPPPDPRLSGCRAGWVKGKRGVIDHQGTYLWRDADEQTWHGPCL